MKLLIWLWNPWEKYTNTKHNIWFMFFDFLKQNTNIWEFKLETKFRGEISVWIINWEKVILLKPQTYMNLSWESVKNVMSFYKINVDDILVVFDDISMNFWKIRFRDKWSAWWHNWIKDIIKFYWDNFKRIKIWIWFNEKYDISDWVLSKFNEEELNILNKDIFPDVLKILKENL